jgi:hypothetical protein
MTSANVINYTIFKDGEEVGRHRQNVMCKTCNDALANFLPAKDYTILAWGYDEEEEEWEDDEQVNLEDWLKAHPAEITFKDFQVNDNVKLNHRRGYGTITEVIKDKKHLFNQYHVKLANGEIFEYVDQNEILPT